VPVLARMFEERERGYRAMGYEVEHSNPPRGWRKESMPSSTTRVCG
jgi:hypothetical protein